jgi:LuxR family quorum sensing-dependent transcriptional regulator
MNYDRTGYQAIEAFGGVSTPQEVFAALKTALNFAGLRHFCLNLFPQPGAPFSDLILTCEVPPAWLELYLREDFAAVDPSIRHCRRVVMPFAYSDTPYDPHKEPRAAEVVRRARDFGVADGTLIPITGPTGCIGDLWVGGKDESFRPTDIPAIHILALYAFHKVQQLMHPAACTTADLSGREREVLKWVANGKTATEIGDVLHISQRTVEWHIQQAAQKLGAKNRMQAVVIAARDQLIEL